MNLLLAQQFGIFHIQWESMHDPKLKKLISERDFYLERQFEMLDKYDQLLEFGEGTAMRELDEKLTFNKDHCKNLDRKISEQMEYLAKETLVN